MTWKIIPLPASQSQRSSIIIYFDKVSQSLWNVSIDQDDNLYENYDISTKSDEVIMMTDGVKGY